jgi:hypothetical protein
MFTKVVHLYIYVALIFVQANLISASLRKVNYFFCRKLCSICIFYWYFPPGELFPDVSSLSLSSCIETRAIVCLPICSFLKVEIH